MKKMFALIAALSLTSAFAVASTSSPKTVKITINASVESACVIIGATAASLDYNAETGDDNIVPSVVSLYCNAGTTPTASLSDDSTTTNGLTVDLQLSGPLVGTGTAPANANNLNYKVTPSADADQWGAATGPHDSSVTFTITF